MRKPRFHWHLDQALFAIGADLVETDLSVVNVVNVISG